MEKTKIVKITNRSSGQVGYKIPDEGIRRQFAPRQTREVTFGELESLSYLSGGDVLLSEYFIIKDPEALAALLPGVEPEYYYTEDEVKNLLLNGSLDELKDCLDFAPDGVIDLVKSLAVSLRLNDVAKRLAILNSTGFDATKSIEILDTKYDGETETSNNATTKRRRVEQPQTKTDSAPIRRVVVKG